MSIDEFLNSFIRKGCYFFTQPSEHLCIFMSCDAHVKAHVLWSQNGRRALVLTSLVTSPVQRAFGSPGLQEWRLTKFNGSHAINSSNAMRWRLSHGPPLH